MLTQTDLEVRDEHQTPTTARWRSRVSHCVLIFFYCLGILLVFDLIYSNLIYKEDLPITDRMPGSKSPARIANAQYHHGLAANFSGYDVWGGSTYRFYTNGLGFKDGSSRRVPLIEDYRRVLLIGDSFTEGIGVPFDQTFAGMLYQDGLETTKKIEFLNAAVV